VQGNVRAIDFTSVEVKRGRAEEEEANRAPASRGEETVMEDQLELVAMSLRGDQDEAEGVRKGLLMLQQFPEEKSREKGVPVKKVFTRSSLQETDYSSSLASPGSSDESKASESEDLPACPSDFVARLAMLESCVLPAQTWIFGSEMKARCVETWKAHNKGQLSISKDEVLDVSFHDFKSQGMDWIFGVKIGNHETRTMRFPGDLSLLRKSCGYFPFRNVHLFNARDPNFSLPDHIPGKQEEELVPLADVPLWREQTAHGKENSLDAIFQQLGASSTDMGGGEVEQHNLSNIWDDSGHDPDSSLPVITPTTDRSESTNTTTTLSEFFSNIHSRTPSSPALPDAPLLPPRAKSPFTDKPQTDSHPRPKDARADVSSSQSLLAHEPQGQEGGEAPRTIIVLRNEGQATERVGLGISISKPQPNGPAHVVSVHPQEAAGKSGLLQVGDLIHAVDGMSTWDLAVHVIDALLVGNPRSMVALAVTRGDEQESGTEAAQGDAERARLKQQVIQHMLDSNLISMHHLLLSGEFEVNQVIEHEQGKTALHMAVENDQVEFVDLLLKHRADPSLQTSSKQTAMTMAEALHSPAIKLLLEAYEADRRQTLQAQEDAARRSVMGATGGTSDDAPPRGFFRCLPCLGGSSCFVRTLDNAP